MSKRFSFAASTGSIDCPRCGGQRRRGEQKCSQCGACDSTSAYDDYDASSSTHRQLSTMMNVEERGHARDFAELSPSAPLMERKLSVKLALGGACIAGVVGSAVTFAILAFAPNGSAPREHIRSIEPVTSDKSDLTDADVAYMNPKTLREINAQLAATNKAPDTTPGSAPEVVPIDPIPSPVVGADLQGHRDIASVSSIDLTTSGTNVRADPITPAENKAFESPTPQKNLTKTNSAASATLSTNPPLTARTVPTKRANRATDAIITSASRPNPAETPLANSPKSTRVERTRIAAEPPVTGAETRQQATAPARFDDLHDPDALEHSIKQFGWK